MTTLNWNQRFAIIDYFNPSDEDICKVFDVTQRELNVARDLRQQGMFKPEPDAVNTEAYATQFSQETNIAITPKAKTDTTPKTKSSPIPKKKVPAKRGRKTHKVKDAYEAMTDVPMPVDEFMKKHNVSLSVLRRHAKFDHIPETGKVNVRKHKIEINGIVENVLCVWREKPKE
jgi:hypothetical protein